MSTRIIKVEDLVGLNRLIDFVRRRSQGTLNSELNEKKNDDDDEVEHRCL